MLTPQRFENLGIADKEFLLRRPKEECQSILKGAGYQLKQDRFDEIWDKAV